MTQREVLQLAKSLMTNNNAGENLIAQGWSFKFVNTKRIVGRCSYRPKLIEYSVNYLNQPVEEITDVILHEIAHALTPGAGHGYAWKRMAVKLGAKPDRCTSSISAETKETLVQVAKYVAVCPNCNRHVPGNRLRKLKTSCGVCSGGQYNPKYELKFVAQR